MRISLRNLRQESSNLINRVTAISHELIQDKQKSLLNPTEFLCVFFKAKAEQVQLLMPV